MLLDVLNLLHNFSENLGAVLRRIPILDQANFDVKFKLVANILIVEPVCKRRFCINDFFDFPSQRAALLIYRMISMELMAVLLVSISSAVAPSSKHLW